MKKSMLEFKNALQMKVSPNMALFLKSSWGCMLKELTWALREKEPKSHTDKRKILSGLSMDDV